MKIRRRTIFRGLISIAVLAVVAAGAYAYLYDRASQTVKTEILKVADEMFFSLDTRATVRRFIEAAHDDAFKEALDLTRPHGHKFDGPLYYRLVFDSVIASARREGMARLADTIEQERDHFTFETAEK